MAGFPRMDQQILRRSYEAGQPAVLNPPSVGHHAIFNDLNPQRIDH